MGAVELERALDDPLAGGVDGTPGLTGLFAGGALEAAAHRLQPEGGTAWAYRRGRRCLVERAAPARAQLPEHLPTHPAPGHQTAVEQAPAGPADLGLVGREQPAQLGATELRRAVEQVQELVGVSARGDARGRGGALESPVGEGNRGV